MPTVSRPAPGAPTVEQLSRKYPKHLPTSAVIGNSQTRYLFHHLNPYDKATPAFITIRGASTFDIERELTNFPRSVTTLIFHVGTSELEKFGSEETLRRCRRLVINTLQARPELHSLVVSLVLPRYTNRRLEQPNDRFIHWFNNETRHFNDTVKGYCRKPGKVTFLDHGFTTLPPRRLLAADGLHPRFSGVALIAQNLKSLLLQGKPFTLTGWSSEIDSLIGIIIYATFAVYQKEVAEAFDDLPDTKSLAEAVFGVYVAYTVICVIGLIVSSLCVRGAYMDQRHYIVPYLVFGIMVLVVQVILAILLIIVVIVNVSCL
ncbi:uncharacterized protein ISCGN_027143 [Ixodes scapularis]